ncbi:MAG: hypothetical protein K2N44_14095 [Lachnospiraceae bacterium]|nr:hypothetical protein [Lachnospiraceae bacterium]
MASRSVPTNREVNDLAASMVSFCPGFRYRELWSGKEMQDEDGVIRWKVQGCDAILLKEV